MLIRERKSSQEKAQAERVQIEMESRHTNAEQAAVEKLNYIQEKAKVHNQKVQHTV